MIARFRGRGDVVGEIISVFIVTNNYGTESAVAVTIIEVTKSTVKRAVKTKEEETEKKRIEDESANRKEIAFAKEIITGDEGHEANQRGDKETANFPNAGVTSEEMFRVETKSGEDENPDRDKERNFSDEAKSVGVEEVWAGGEVGAEIIGKKEGKENRRHVGKNQN